MKTVERRLIELYRFAWFEVLLRFVVWNIYVFAVDLKHVV